MTHNTVKIGQIPTSDFPFISELAQGQMFRYPNGAEPYMFCGMSSQTCRYLFIQLKNGRRCWQDARGSGLSRVIPLPAGTRVEITQG